MQIASPHCSRLPSRGYAAGRRGVGIETLIGEEVEANDVVYLEGGDHKHLLRMTGRRFQVLMVEVRHGQFGKKMIRLQDLTRDRSGVGRGLGVSLGGSPDGRAAGQSGSQAAGLPARASQNDVFVCRTLGRLPHPLAHAGRRRRALPVQVHQ